jgi:hypothetical protein
MPISYGVPSPETLKALRQGELRVVIGGCVVDESNLFWACPACEHRW